MRFETLVSPKFILIDNRKLSALSDLFLKQHMDMTMNTTTAKRPFKKGRIFFMSLISLTLFISVTGFGPLPARDLDIDTLGQQETLSEGFSYTQDLDSFVSHNLIVNVNELRCLALNIYWEARSEPLKGQLAVAGVTLNRVASPKFPDTICNVVKQGNKARLHRCQFSWNCDGESDSPKDIKSWRHAQQLARLFQARIYADPTGKALWYHADYVTPYWAPSLQKTTQIGRHIFFKAKAKRTSAPMS